MKNIITKDETHNFKMCDRKTNRYAILVRRITGKNSNTLEALSNNFANSPCGKNGGYRNRKNKIRGKNATYLIWSDHTNNADRMNLMETNNTNAIYLESTTHGFFWRRQKHHSVKTFSTSNADRKKEIRWSKNQVDKPDKHF